MTLSTERVRTYFTSFGNILCRLMTQQYEQVNGQPREAMTS